MIDALHAERIKLRTLAATAWLVLGAVVATIGVSAAVAVTIHISPGGPGAHAQDPTKLALIGVDVGQAVIAVLAVLAVTDEYATGMIRVSLTATPRRRALLGAKAITTAALALVAGSVAIAGCLITGRLLLPAAGLNHAHGYALVSVTHGATLRAALGSVLYLALVAVLSLGVATIVRDTAVSTGVVLGLLYLPLILADLVTGSLHRRLEQLAPMSAGLAIQATRHPTTFPISPWAGLGVLAAWAAGALLIGAASFTHRDA